MDNKKLFSLLVLSIFIQCLFIQSSYAVTLKIATLSPDGTSWMKKMRAGAKQIYEQTQQRVKIKFYPGGVMGNDQAVLKKIRIRQLHGGAVTGGTLLPFYPSSQVYGSLLAFESADEVTYVRKHMDKMLINGFDQGGFVTFGLAESGFNYIMSKQPIKSVADLSTQKPWIPAGDNNALEMIKTFSITPIPLAISDVLAGLQTGLVDTVAISPIGALALQWHTQIKYITQMPLFYSFGALAVNKKSFNKIKKSDQKIVRNIFERIFKNIDTQNKKDNVAAIAALKNQGIQFIIPSAAQIKEWKSLATKSLNIFNGHIQNFRNTQK